MTFAENTPHSEMSTADFPFGPASGGSLAIWATGFMATEPEIDYNNQPTFLIDCRARPAQCGLAVIAHRNDGMVTLEGGGTAAFSGPVTRFLGIYSRRINEQSDLGIVWKASSIKELIDSIV